MGVSSRAVLHYSAGIALLLQYISFPILSCATGSPQMGEINQVGIGKCLGKHHPVPIKLHPDPHEGLVAQRVLVLAPGPVPAASLAPPCP